MVLQAAMLVFLILESEDQWSVDMNHKELNQLISRYGMDHHRDFLLNIARPSINIFIGEFEPLPRSSKFGGSPDVPCDFIWPTHAKGQYKFLAQFSLSDPAFKGFGLPTDAMLSFFHSASTDGYEEYFEGVESIRVFLFKGLAELSPRVPPPPVDRSPCRAVDLKPGLSLPDKEWCKANSIPWPIVSYADSDCFWEIRLDTIPGSSFLFGYPFNNTLAYDPTPGPEWRSLLTLGSHDEMDWSWHDGSWMVTFIKEQSLRSGDFSLIKSDAG